MNSSAFPTNTPAVDTVPHPAEIGAKGYALVFSLLMIAVTCFGHVLGVFNKKRDSRFPLVLYTGSAKKDMAAFQTSATAMVEKGRKEHPGKPFFIINDMGPYLILPPHLVNDIRNIKTLNFQMWLKDYFHNGATEFEPFVGASREDELFQRVARKRLTKSLKWFEYTLSSVALDVIARVSSKVLLGDELCRNEEWLELTKSYTVKGFMAVETLKQKHRLLRPILKWFDPMCQDLRRSIDHARRLIGPVVEERRRNRSEAIARGEKAPVFNDAIDWFDLEADGKPYDPVLIQMTISVSSIHSTMDLMLKTIYRIAEHPGLADELRQELLDAVKVDGWKKTTLYELSLLDSVLKETQRLEPLSFITMNRFAEMDTTLPDGTFIPKGVRLGADTGFHFSSEYYDDPTRFDPYRFVRWRKTEKESLSHLVSTSPHAMGFGHGQHSCPGRFFAANELKVIFSHLLLKYEWKLAEGSSAASLPLGVRVAANPATRVMVRRRPVVELDLDRC
ncbi:hypothetical protein MCOR25_002028 [Pyricularia grisea]|uniref:Uncharacterized protein n=1 Tax=Pyricularia grisea TaxID=148305 RepID=A0A6P8AMI2_PYRGI|nr:uncharacterized protein PgNI_12439 [Pyricularia grisea]KAI6379152.1 hypothetical protein MCOR25_002028 [Pyricularia grisea]TLD03237.1 hypothetical protein PgNI_12439 [Pyricularia grisea]